MSRLNINRLRRAKDENRCDMCGCFLADCHCYTEAVTDYLPEDCRAYVTEE